MWGKFSNAFSNIFKKQLHDKNKDINLREGKEGIKFKLKKSSPIFKTVGPVALWLITFFVVPLLLVLVVSFLSRGEYGDIRLPFTLKNYKRLMDPMYGEILIKTLIISISTTLGCLIIGYPFAYFIGRADKKYRGLLLLLVILPFWTNSLVRTYAWIILLKTEGVINTYLMKFGYFFISDLMGGSKTMLISNLIKNQFLTSRDWPFGSAIAVILIILMLIAIGFYFKGNKAKGTEEVN